jgi:hypothetical protein
MITMDTPFRPSWRRHRRAVPTTTIYRVTDRRQEELRSLRAEQHRYVFRVDGRLPTMTALQWQSSKR